MNKTARKLWGQLWPGIAVGTAIGAAASIFVLEVRPISAGFGVVVTLILNVVVFELIGSALEKH